MDAVAMKFCKRQLRWMHKTANRRYAKKTALYPTIRTKYKKLILHLIYLSFEDIPPFSTSLA